MKKIINPWRNHEAAKHASMMALDDGILINGVVFASLNNANIYYVRACLAFWPDTHLYILRLSFALFCLVVLIEKCNFVALNFIEKCSFWLLKVIEKWTSHGHLGHSSHHTQSVPVTTFLSKEKEKNLAVLQKKRIFAAKKKQTSH